MTTLEKPLIADSTDLVTYLIKVDDVEISKEHHVLSITVEIGVNKIPAATLVINDGEVSIQDFELGNSGIFLPGKTIEIGLGYNKNGKEENTTVFKGLITKNSHKINQHCSELTIECKHPADVLTYTKVNHIPEVNSFDSDMIKFILEKHKERIGDVEVNPSTLKHPQVVQVNTTDWDFIMSRVDIAGMICTFPDSKITVKKIPAEDSQLDKPDKQAKADNGGAAPGQTSRTDFILTYGRNILEFDGELDERVEASMIKVQTWNYQDQKVEETESERKESGEDSGDDKKKKEEEEAAKKLEYLWLINTPAHIDRNNSEGIAETKKRRQQLSKIKGTVKYIGTTKLSPGTFAKINGVGDRFNGKAFVSNVLHEYADGCWITTATLGWDEKLFTEQTNAGHPASSTGQSSSIQGLQVGKVTNIEDADGDYRVKVKLPMVDDGSEGIYARIATLDAGKDRGTFFRPEVDDEVVIGFMGDDPSNPVILGCVHSRVLKSPLEPEKKNNKKGYVSRSAIKLLFDDEKKSLTIETPGSKVFELNDKEGTISIKDEFDNRIVMEKAGISMESAGNLKIKAAKEITIEAGAALKLKGTSSVKVEASGSITIQSSGNTAIKGSMVMIN